MNILVLNLHRLKLSFSLFRGREEQPFWCGDTAAAGSMIDSGALRASLGRVYEGALCMLKGESLHGVSLIVKYGGSMFKSAEEVCPDSLARLESLASQAPLHAPSAARLARAAAEVFQRIPVVLVFETAFFTALPAREYSYALDTGMAKSMELRRFGYHGLFHEAACLDARHHRLASGVAAPGRYLSLCLEPRPELAAVLDHVPLMVTGGATPLEGLPGRTSCGEIDPSIVISLASGLGWGPEQINETLTRRSGILGLTGKSVDLGEIIRGGEQHRQARELVRYRILLACGMGIAALGGLDTIVISGRFSAAGETLGLWLRDSIHLNGCDKEKAPRFEIFRKSLARVAADRAAGLMIGSSRPSLAA
ncbi:hypothetical protein LLH00_11330 [bacterium]|nr:hypothetical protein [bacterium]